MFVKKNHPFFNCRKKKAKKQKETIMFFCIPEQSQCAKLDPKLLHKQNDPGHLYARLSLSSTYDECIRKCPYFPNYGADMCGKCKDSPFTGRDNIKQCNSRVIPEDTRTQYRIYPTPRFSPDPYTPESVSIFLPDKKADEIRNLLSLQKNEK